MASLADKTFAFEADASRVKSQKTLMALFEKFLLDLGADKFLCAYVGDDISGKAIKRSMSNIPRDWQETYLARGYEASDPVFLCVTSAGACGYWDELTRYANFGAKADEVMDFAASIGMEDGFTKRIMLDGGGVAIVMVAGRKLLRGREARTALRLATHIFAHEGARMISVPVRSSIEDGIEDLSPSQRQVLQMRAEGLSNVEVAARTGTVAKTVESHVTQILRKLKARNMIDAIRIAKELRLLG